MKMIIRAVSAGAMGGKDEVLAEVILKQEVPQEDLDFLRAKLELAFAELHEQEVAARYDFEEQTRGSGLVFQPRIGPKFPFLPHGDDVQHVVVIPTGEAKSILGKLTGDQHRALDAWTNEQAPNGGGSIDLMRWPGWAEALQANIQSK